MTDFYKLARTFRDRADRLEHCAEQVGPLPKELAVLGEIDEDGNELALADYGNEFIRDAIAALREQADLLMQLAYNADSTEAFARDAAQRLCEHNPDAYEAADEGWLDGMAYADDARDMY